MSEIADKRRLLTRNQAILVLACPTLIKGAELAIDQVRRTLTEAEANSESGAGIGNSLHLLGLAVDLNLYINGKYMADTASHAPLGTFWKTLHPLNRWGGDFRPKPDGNHYSIEHAGVK